jgi:NADPH:quinone reductase
MQAAWYETQGPARDVLVVGEMPDPQPGPGEVSIRISASGINPGDIKKRQDSFGFGMAFPRVIPHSDGAGVIDQVGEGVSTSRIGERVWCFGAQSYRPFGTAAEYTVVPADQAVPLPEAVSFEQGACLGIPGITAYQAVHVAGPVRDRVVLVQGGAGAVGVCAVGLARHAGAHVIATVRSEADEAIARRVGAHQVGRTDGRSVPDAAQQIIACAPGGVQHIVEVAFDANIGLDEAVLTQGGSIAAYATGVPEPAIPFWPLLFKNVRLYLLGSDDFPMTVKSAAARQLNEALSGGWPGFDIARRFRLEEITTAHECVEGGREKGRIVVITGRV